MTETRKKLIATFVPKNNVKWMFTYLKTKFKIEQKNIFVYEIENNEIEYFVTFNLEMKQGMNLDFLFENSIVVNVKNKCFFTVNSLNRLIEEESGCDKGNIRYKDFKIDWSKYENKVILLNNDNLVIRDIKKIDVKL